MSINAPFTHPSNPNTLHLKYLLSLTVPSWFPFFSCNSTPTCISRYTMTCSFWSLLDRNESRRMQGDISKHHALYITKILFFFVVPHLFESRILRWRKSSPISRSWSAPIQRIYRVDKNDRYEAYFRNRWISRVQTIQRWKVWYPWNFCTALHVCAHRSFWIYCISVTH